MQWGARRPGAIVVAFFPFALAAYLAIADKAGGLLPTLLVIVAAILALRGFGLRRAVFEADPEGGALRVDTEFEGPEDP